MKPQPIRDGTAPITGIQRYRFQPHYRSGIMEFYAAADGAVSFAGHVVLLVRSDVSVYEDKDMCRWG